jgi:integrase/recombinase XerD
MTQYKSRLSHVFDAFVALKLASGYRYNTEQALLKRFDRYLVDRQCSSTVVSREIVEQWTAKSPHERPRTQSSRLTITIQFLKHARSYGVDAYIPDSRLAAIKRTDFVPYIFTHSQMRHLLIAVDQLKVDSRAPERHIVMPVLFRLLCGCGLRVSEAVNLKFGNVNLNDGTLRINDTKFHKDRLIPLSKSVSDQLADYCVTMGFRQIEEPLFPTAAGKAYDKRTVYQIFRSLLRQTGIQHGGRGCGPRLHDLRHTFAVHCLERWYRNGDDLHACLPLLVVYLGHQTLLGTQRYLQLTPRIFPEINQKLEALFHGCNSLEAHS